MGSDLDVGVTTQKLVALSAWRRRVASALPKLIDYQAANEQVCRCIRSLTTRTLETWARTGKTSGWTDLFITPGFEFKAVKALVANFHVPKSTLLMLVCALAGRDKILAAYAEAVRQKYRFFSYGDAMLILT